MNAVLVLVASFVMVFFIVLIFMGVLIGSAAALSHLVEWIVAPDAGSDLPARSGHEERLAGDRR
jgi:hypothetical protein